MWPFLGVAALVVLAPGPDMALVTKNAILHGRRAALGTTLGVVGGLLVWTLAAALGVAALVQASAVAFTVLKLLGAAYLVWLGIQALRTTRRRSNRHPEPANGRQLGGRRGFRQGLASNLANPKIAVLFTSLLPQFVTPHASALAPMLLLGAVFVAMTLIWLTGYAIFAARAAHVLQRPSLARMLDRLTGVVLIGIGLRLATEHR